MSNDQWRQYRHCTSERIMASVTNIICLVMSQLAPSGSEQIVRATPVIWAIVRWSPDCWAIVRQSLGNHVNLNHHKLPLTGLVVSEGKEIRSLVVGVLLLILQCLTMRSTCLTRCREQSQDKSFEKKRFESVGLCCIHIGPHTYDRPNQQVINWVYNEHRGQRGTLSGFPKPSHQY